MREADIIYKTKAALSFAARGGLRASLFTDAPWEDAEMMFEAEVLEGVPRSQMPVVVQAITEWREDNKYLSLLEDKTP